MKLTGLKALVPFLLLAGAAVVPAHADNEYRILNFVGKKTAAVRIDGKACKVGSSFNKNYKKIEWTDCDAIIYADRTQSNHRDVIRRNPPAKRSFWAWLFGSAHMSSRAIVDTSLGDLLSDTFVMSPADTLRVALDPATARADEILLSFATTRGQVTRSVPTASGALIITPALLEVDGVFPAPRLVVVSLYARHVDRYRLITDALCLELVARE